MNREIQKICRHQFARQHAGVGTHHRLVEIGVTHIAPVHKEILVRRSRSRLRLAYKTGYSDHLRLDMHVYQLTAVGLSCRLAEDGFDTLFKRLFR